MTLLALLPALFREARGRAGPVQVGEFDAEPGHGGRAGYLPAIGAMAQGAVERFALRIVAYGAAITSALQAHAFSLPRKNSPSDRAHLYEARDANPSLSRAA